MRIKKYWQIWVSAILTAIIAFGVTQAWGVVELRQSTAVTIKFGPMVDATDGVTPETALTADADHIELAKNGGNIAAKNDANVPAHDEDGYWNILLDATDTGTLGVLRVMWTDANAGPAWQDFAVVTANYWDSKYSTDYRHVDVIQVLGEAPGDYDAIMDANDNIMAAVAAAQATIDLIEGYVDTVESLLGTAQGDLDILTGSDGATLATAQALYAPSKAGDAMALTVGARGSLVDAVHADLYPNIALILADSNELQTDWANGGRLDLILDAAGNPWSSLAADNVIPDSFGKIMNDLTEKYAGDGLYRFTLPALFLTPKGGRY